MSPWLRSLTVLELLIRTRSRRTRDAMDWSDLSSQNIPSLGQSSGFQWNLPVTGAADSSGFAAVAGAGAPPPFSSSFSAATGIQAPNTLSAPYNAAAPAQQPGEAAGTKGGTWDDRIARHEQEMVDRIIERAEIKTRKQILDIMERDRQAAMKAEREMWIKKYLGTSSAPSSSTPLQVKQLHGAPGESRAAATPISHRRSAAGGSFDRLESSLVRDHLNIMSSNSDLAMTAAKMSMLTLPPGDLSGAYQHMWQYIEELLKMKINSPSGLEQSIAYLTFLCKQTQNYIVQRVRAASLAGNNPLPASGSQYQNNMASTCAAFVKLTVADSQRANALWPVAYFCLRSGDATAAAEVLMAMGMHESDQPSDASLLRLVNTMASAQGNRPCIWEGMAVRLDASDREAVAVLLASARNQEQQDIYQVGVYTLCCATDVLPTPDNVFGFSSVEDYLCGSLWKAILADQPQEELITFGETISGFGVEYFGENLVPFFVAQQYENLVTHLANDFGRLGLLYATHLGLILSSAGVPLRDLQRGADSKSNYNLEATLAVAYSDMLLADNSFGISASVEYLAKIPNKARACQEVASLIAKTGRTDQLVGSLNNDGLRTGPTLLDKHFSSDEIADILSAAATQLLRDKNDRNKMSTAVLCLSLAEKFADSLALMGALLSPPDQTDPLRSHWMVQAESFYNTFLAKATHVGDVLEKENKASCVSTIRKMIDLNKFFQLCRDRKLTEAWSLLEQVDFLPLSQQDMSSKISEYPRLDELLKQALPAVAVAAVNLLHAEYEQTLRASQQFPQSQSVAKQRMNQLKESIDTIGMYTSMAGIPFTQEQRGNLNRIAAVVS